MKQFESENIMTTKVVDGTKFFYIKERLYVFIFSTALFTRFSVFRYDYNVFIVRTGVILNFRVQ